MRLNVYAAGLCAIVFGAVSSAGPADAATQKKKQAASNQSQSTTTGRPRARITVERRSFLDAGTETLPGDRKFTDYAFPPGHSPYSALGPFRDFRRQPLLDPWDFPGVNKGW
jgi:hypothetical protein